MLLWVINDGGVSPVAKINCCGNDPVRSGPLSLHHTCSSTNDFSSRCSKNQSADMYEEPVRTGSLSSRFIFARELLSPGTIVDHSGFNFIIDRYPRLEARVSYKRKGFYYLVVTFFLGKVTLSKCQISSTYSWMVLSDVNLPLHATFRIALFAQPFSSLYAASTRFCASA